MKKTFNFLLIFILLMLFNGCILKRKKHHHQNDIQTQNNSQRNDIKQINGIAYDGLIYGGKIQILDNKGNVLGESITSSTNNNLGEFHVIIKNKLPNIFYIKLLNGVDTGLDDLINKNDANISFPIFSVGESNASFISVSPLSDIWYKIMKNYGYSFEETKKIINKAFNIKNNLTLVYLNPKNNLLLKKIILFINAIKMALPFNSDTNLLVNYIVLKQNNLIDINKVDYQDININNILGYNYYNNDEIKFIDDNLFDILNSSNENNLTMILSSLKSIMLLNMKHFSNDSKNVQNVQFLNIDIDSTLFSDILNELNFYDLNDFIYFKNKYIKILPNIDSEFLKKEFNTLDYLILNNLPFSKDLLLKIIDNSKKIYNDLNNTNYMALLGKELLYISLINNDVNVSNALKIAETYDTEELVKFSVEGGSFINSYFFAPAQNLNLIFNMYSVYIMNLKKELINYDQDAIKNYISQKFEDIAYSLFTIKFFNKILNNVHKSKYAYLIIKNFMIDYARYINARTDYDTDANFISNMINQIINKINTYKDNETEKIITLIHLCKYIDLYKFNNDLSSRIIPLTNKIFNVFNRKNIAYMASLENFERKFKSKLINKEQINDNDIQSSIVYVYIDNNKLPVIPKIVDFNIK